MPKGKPTRSRRAAPSPASIPGVELEVIDYGTVRQTLETVVSKALTTESDKTRFRIIQETPEALECLIALAKGIKLQNVGGAHYTVPPYFPALRFFLEWSRSLLGQDKKDVRVHEIDPATQELLREWIRTDVKPPMLIPSNGVITLED